MAIGVGFYLFHLEETPSTNRSRFMPITHVQMNELAVIVYKEVAELLEDSILPVDNPDHMRVFRVAQKLIKANVLRGNEPSQVGSQRCVCRRSI